MQTIRKDVGSMILLFGAHIFLLVFRIFFLMFRFVIRKEWCHMQLDIGEAKVHCNGLCATFVFYLFIGRTSGRV